MTARAPHRGTHGGELRARRRGRNLVHRQPATDVVGVDRGVLQAEVDEGLLQALRVPARDRVDRDEWHGAAAALHEMRGRAERVQVLERVIGAHPIQVS